MIVLLFEEFNYVPKVSIRKSWSPIYLGPFKGFGARYHGRQMLVELLLIEFGWPLTNKFKH